MATERNPRRFDPGAFGGEHNMNEDVAFVLPVALTWAVLAAVYALAPWSDMVGYAWVWGFGSLLFLVLAGLLWRSGRGEHATDDRA